MYMLIYNSNPLNYLDSQYLSISIIKYGIEQNRNDITLKLLQFLVTLHTYTTIYNFGDKAGHNNNG